MYLFHRRARGLTPSLLQEFSAFWGFLEDVITDTVPQNTGAVPVQVFISLVNMAKMTSPVNGPLSEIRLARLM